MNKKMKEIDFSTLSTKLRFWSINNFPKVVWDLLMVETFLNIGIHRMDEARAQINWNNLILIFNSKRILSLIYFKIKLWDSLPAQVRPPSFK